MVSTPSVVTVTTSGTPVQVWPNGPGGGNADYVPARLVNIQNTHASGVMYVGVAGMVISTLAGVLEKVTAGNSFRREDQNGENTIDCTQYWIDHSVSGAVALASYSRR